LDYYKPKPMSLYIHNIVIHTGTWWPDPYGYQMSKKTKNKFEKSSAWRNRTLDSDDWRAQGTWWYYTSHWQCGAIYPIDSKKTKRVTRREESHSHAALPSRSLRSSLPHSLAALSTSLTELSSLLFQTRITISFHSRHWQRETKQLLQFVKEEGSRFQANLRRTCISLAMTRARVQRTLVHE
jgi:hypothetical protein